MRWNNLLEYEVLLGFPISRTAMLLKMEMESQLDHSKTKESKKFTGRTDLTYFAPLPLAREIIFLLAKHFIFSTLAELQFLDLLRFYIIFQASLRKGYTLFLKFSVCFYRTPTILENWILCTKASINSCDQTSSAYEVSNSQIDRII